MGEDRPRILRGCGPRLGLGGTRSPRRTHRHPLLHSPAVPTAGQPPVRRRTPKEPELMPLPRRGRGPLLAGPRMASTSLPQATAHSPRRVGRGTPLSSSAQRLTPQRHSSEQVPPGPEPQADFRSGGWLQKGSGGDARDSRQTPCAGMGSRHRSVPAVPLGRAALTSCTVLSAQCATALAYTSAFRSPPRPGPLGTDLLATVPFRKPPAGGWTRPRGGPETGPPVIGRSHCHSVVSLQPGRF